MGGEVSQLVSLLMAEMRRQGGYQGELHFEERRQGGQESQEWSTVILEVKHFRRMDKFEGDPGKFRSWLFDLTLAIGQIENGLARELSWPTKRK